MHPDNLVQPILMMHLTPQAEQKQKKKHKKRHREGSQPADAVPSGLPQAPAHQPSDDLDDRSRPKRMHMVGLLIFNMPNAQRTKIVADICTCTEAPVDVFRSAQQCHQGLFRACCVRHNVVVLLPPAVRRFKSSVFNPSTGCHPQILSGWHNDLNALGIFRRTSNCSLYLCTC